MGNMRHQDDEERRRQKTEHKGRSREAYRETAESRQVTPVRTNGEVLPRQSGKVKRIVAQKGFGFITAEGKEFFFHRSEAPDFDSLEEGQAITFQPMESPKGPRAHGVTIDLE